MKKYNRIIVCSILIYVVIAVCTAVFLFQNEKYKSNVYRVEVNRLMNSFETVDQVNNWSRDPDSLVQSVELLKPSTDKKQVVSFFEEQNDVGMVMVPWYQDDIFLGYLKFTYEISLQNFGIFLVVVELGLLFLEVFILSVLWYIKGRILLPFYRMKELPQELAKGHFKGSVNIEKDGYFKEFLWGMSQLKDELDQTSKKNMEFMKEKKKLLLSLSHDMKTPLNIIKLYVKSLEDGIYETDEKRLEALHKLVDKTTDIEHYIEEITKSSREELIDFTVLNEEFYLSEMIEKVLPIYEEQCALHNIEFVVSKFDDCLLNGDCDRSREVLENVLENAIKYGDGGKIELSFWEEDYCHLISITNTGTPVSENEIPHLFDSFFRGKNARVKSGNGMGLYICRELMHMMGGTIYAEIGKKQMTFILVFR